jgi:hypothetical protein
MDPPTSMDRLQTRIQEIIIKMPIIGERYHLVFNAKSKDILLMSVLIHGNLKIMYPCVKIVKQLVILQTNVLSLKMNINLIRGIGRNKYISEFKMVDLGMLIISTYSATKILIIRI